MSEIDTSYMYTEVAQISKPKELIFNQVKTQTINVLISKLDNLAESTDDDKIKNIIVYNKLILADCLKIDMYKFQFKSVKDMIEKDIKNIQEALALRK